MCQNRDMTLFFGCPLRLLALGLITIFFCAGAEENEKYENRRNQERKTLWNETSHLSLLHDSENTAGKIRSTASQNAWMLLLNNERSKNTNKKKSRKFKYGTPGLLKPSDPPGHPCDTITQEELLKKFQLLLKGIIREQKRMDVKTTSKNCQHGEDGREENLFVQISGPLPKSREQGRVEAAFYCRTQRNISVEEQTLQELQRYYIPRKEKLFHRGTGLNLHSGQYVVPISGYYMFSARLHIIPEAHQKKYQSCTRDHLRLLICVQSLCHQNTSLETVSFLDNRSEYFTISVSGILFLQAGQYASVFIDNATGSSFIVRNGSDFSVVLLGN